MSLCWARYPFEPAQTMPWPDWERFTGSIVSDILGEQSPRQLLVVRAKLYQLLINCIPASVIMKVRYPPRFPLPSAIRVHACEGSSSASSGVLWCAPPPPPHRRYAWISLSASLTRTSLRSW